MTTTTTQSVAIAATAAAAVAAAVAGGGGAALSAIVGVAAAPALALLAAILLSKMAAKRASAKTLRTDNSKKRGQSRAAKSTKAKSTNRAHVSRTNHLGVESQPPASLAAAPGGDATEQGTVLPAPLPAPTILEWLRGLDAAGSGRNRFVQYAANFEEQFDTLEDLMATYAEVGIDAIADACGVTALGDKTRLKRAIAELINTDEEYVEEVD